MSDSFLKRQLVRYRDLLANLSRRNREIYFKERRGSSVSLSVSPFLPSAFHENNESIFVPMTPLSPKFDEVLKGKELNLNDHFQIDHLKDFDAASKLNKKLDKIRLADDRHQREFGISGAWLLGPFLCWRTSAQAPKADLMISPILKVPVDLKINKRKKMDLIVEDENLSLNPSLRLCLKQKIGLDIPENLVFTSVEEALTYLKEALAKIDKKVSICEEDPYILPKIPPRFKIIKDENGDEIERTPVSLEDNLNARDLKVYDAITATDFMVFDVLYLDQLNASRTVLINDYETILENPSDHPILTELFNGTPLAVEPAMDRSKLRELDSYRERENHFVVNIDSTQHRAIREAMKAKAIVIQGPPGTGKSQSITNLIAEFIAQGKRVLFVSEKRPALDVVFNRLKSAGIESKSVLIHSSELNKSDLYKSFLDLADSAPNQRDEREWTNATEALDRIKSEINAYADTLQKEHSPSLLSIGEVLFLAVETNRELFHPELAKRFGILNLTQIDELSKDLDEIQRVFAQLKDFRSSPWITRNSSTIRSSMLHHALESLKADISNADAELQSILTQILEVAGEPNVTVSPDLLSLAGSLPATKGQNYSPLWRLFGDDPLRALNGLRETLESTRAKLQETIDGYTAIQPGTDLGLIAELENYYRLPRGFADWFSAPFWAYRRARRQICPKWDGSNRQFTQYREHVDTFQKLQHNSKSIVDSAALSVNSFSETKSWIDQTIKVVVELQKFFSSAKRVLPTKMLNESMNSQSGYESTSEKLKLLSSYNEKQQSVLGEAKSKWHKLSEHLAVLPPFTSDLGAALEHISRLISSMKDLDVLDQGDMLLQTTIKRTGIVNLRQIVIETFADIVEPWSLSLRSSVFNGWLDDIAAQHPSIRSFDQEKFQQLVSTFKKNEEQHRLAARQAIHQSFAKMWANGSDRTGLPLLKKEAGKQRKVMSPREIMEKGALKTMMQLKPCWLMSPLSISQILPLHKGLFDVIIFDEASQVRVEDAVPSIYRAGSMIVVGDKKQMPPTSFFSGSVSDDDDDEEEPISESILDMASIVYPSVLLEWHYRSRAEALIAFSNRAFYGGRLIAAPNPSSLSASGAIKYFPVPEAYFVGKNGNQKEAETVIDHLIKMIDQNPRRSYGVIAMGQPQAVALEEALDRRLSNDNSAKALIDRASSFIDGEADAGLFIKNLENVQGDERDVILISVGYAPANAGSKLRMNFGPLSKQGGGRRLNVAITRAKSETHVFSSFSPSAIATDEEVLNRNPDLAIFGRYLKYAEAVSSGNVDVAMSILNSFPMAGTISQRRSSRFALDVKRRLEELGHLVSAEIGTSGFYIDLAIHHPVFKSNFVLGIECDGAIFHSTPYARDRDKIREDLLKARGWRIERVWSQDWSRDWKKEVARLDACIRKIMESPELADALKKASNQ